MRLALLMCAAVRTPPTVLVNMLAPITSETSADLMWVDVPASRAPRLMSRYFGTQHDPTKKYEAFCIHGVPLAVLSYNRTNVFRHPVVHSFEINRNAVLFANAADRMRRELYKRYRHIHVCKARNAEVFLEL